MVPTSASRGTLDDIAFRINLGKQMEIVIKELSVDHYDQLLVGWKSLPGSAIGIGDDYDSIKKYLNRNRGLSYGAFYNSKLIGAILADHDGRRGKLNHLYVLEEYRKNKIATRLVEKSITALKSQGIKRIWILIHNTNIDAIKFWESIGFKEVEILKIWGKNI